MSFGPSAREMAHGHWREILIAAGVREDLLVDHHGICPLCGSLDKDWFRFDDKDGRGTYICAGCGAGDGFQFLMRYQGTSSFMEAARFVEGFFKGQSKPIVPVKTIVTNQKDPQEEKKRIAHALQKAWSESKLVLKGDPVYRYLTETRGLPVEGLTDCLKCHHEMPYFKKEKAQNGKLVLRKKGSHPVMLAKVISPTGSPVGLHRTYLTKDGKKAPYAKTKKLMEGLGLHGGAIRLYPITSAVMGVAEGIETSIAAHALTGVPTWATISSTIMEGFEPPAEVKLVVIFVDHDRPDSRGRQAGFIAAKKLRERMEERGTQVILAVPKNIGTDMDDVWKSRKRELAPDAPHVTLYADAKGWRVAQTIAARLQKRGVHPTVRAVSESETAEPSKKGREAA